MRLKVERRKMEIIPESETDIAYIEEVLKLNAQDDKCMCKRENAHALNSIAYIEISANK